MFDQLRADYIRHGRAILNPPFWAICNYRFGNWALRIRFPFFRWLVSKIYGFNLFIILITGGIELKRETKIGKNLHLIHTGNIRIHPNTVIGDRCGIMHDVTIGINMQGGAPQIGNDVFIGVGAKVLGDIVIGDKAVIAANSLVTVDVPSGAVAIGVPAKIINRKQDRLS